ncbi:MAG: type II toxin-antitoxin system RelE/ParE family toxin [Candidatus Aenigmatarchaeota archaeon]
MAYDVKLHPKVMDFLDSLHAKDRDLCTTSLRTLKENPFEPRPGTDIKKLQGKLHTLYRLRVGKCRFEYFVEANIVWVTKAFRREQGY